MDNQALFKPTTHNNSFEVARMNTMEQINLAQTNKIWDSYARQTQG